MARGTADIVFIAITARTLFNYCFSCASATTAAVAVSRRCTRNTLHFESVLFIMKIIIIVATRCQLLRLKCIKFDFSWGSAPDPAGEAYSAPPDLVAGGEGLAAPSPSNHPALGPSGLESLHKICSVDSHENNYN